MDENVEREYEKETLYIPQGLKTRKEYFDGFGKAEAMQALLAVSVINVLNIVFFLVMHSVPKSMLIFMVSVAAAIMFLQKDSTTNISVVDQVRFMIRFAKSQKKYPYKYLDEWGKQ